MWKPFRASAAPALICLTIAILFSGLAPARADPEFLAVSPDGHRLYVPDAPRGGIDVIDTATNQLLATLLVPNHGHFGRLAVNPNGSQLYLQSDSDLSLLVINLADGKVVATIPVGNTGSMLVVSPKGDRLYVVPGIESKSVSVVDTASDQVIATVPVGHTPTGAGVTPDGKKLYVTGADDLHGPNFTLRGGVAVIDTGTNRLTAVVRVHTFPYAVAMSPDGQRVYVTHLFSDSSTVDVIDTKLDRMIGDSNLIPGGWSLAATVSPDSKRLYLMPQPWNLVGAIDATQRKVLGSVVLGQPPVYLVISPDGRRLYVLHSSPTSPKISPAITVLDAATLNVVTTIDLAKGAAGGN